MNIRSRLCGAPTSLAASIVHSASNPRPASDPRTVPIARTSRRSCHWHRATARLRSPMTRAIRAEHSLARSRLPFDIAMSRSLSSQMISRAQASLAASALRCSGVGSSPRAVSRPRTFSISTSDGRSSAIAVATWCHTPDRLPCSRPARWPAWDRSVHGNPAHSTSTGSTCDQSASEMSPRFLIPGNRQASSFAAAGSLSATHASSPPMSGATAAPMPSYPEHRLPMR